MEENRKNKTKYGTWLLCGFCLCFALLSTAAAVFSLFGRQFHLAELANNFRLQISAMMLLAAISLVILRWRRFSMILVVFVMLYAWPILATVVPVQNSQPGDRVLKLVSFNILGKNQNQEPVLNLLRQSEADFILLLEYENLWIESLEMLEEKYPHHIKEPRWHGFGIALYSKHPIVDSKVVQLTKGLTDNPAILTEIEMGDQSLILAGAHFLAPMSPERLDIRNQQMQEIAGLINTWQEDKQLPVLLAGDFNCVPWSAFAQQLMKSTGLRDSRQGYFYHGTFPADNDLISIPIDHVFLSSQIFVHRRQVLPGTSSDHYPLSLEFSVSLEELLPGATR